MMNALEDFKRRPQARGDANYRLNLLEEAYKEAMERINSQREGLQQLAHKVLLWVACARRPLRTAEIQHAVGVRTGQGDIDFDALPQISTMISVCAGLVTVDEESKIIRLVHYTTQEFFQKTQSRWFPGAQAIITDVCLTYLSFKRFESLVEQKIHNTQIFGLLEDFNSPESRWEHNCFRLAELKELYVLYDYASFYWVHHASATLSASRSGRQSDQIERQILTFLEGKGRLHIFLGNSCSEDLTKFSPTYRYKASFPNTYWEKMALTGQLGSLHAAAYYGLPSVFQKLLDRGRLTNLKSECCLMRCAVLGGNQKIVKILLDEGIAVQGKDADAIRPLSVAVHLEYIEIAQILLDKGADPNGIDIDRSTPLSYALLHGSEKMVKILLNKARLDSRDRLGDTPIWIAADSGDQIIVRLLLEWGADPNEVAINRSTALEQAVWRGAEEVVWELLEVGASTNGTGINGRNPLEMAIWNGDVAIVELLLDFGAVCNRDSVGGNSPLILAIESEQLDVISALLDRGAEEEDSKKALHLAYIHRSMSVVKFLLERGIKPQDAQLEAQLYADVQEEDRRSQITVRAGNSGPREALSYSSVPKHPVKSSDSIGARPNFKRQRL